MSKAIALSNHRLWLGAAVALVCASAGTFAFLGWKKIQMPRGPLAPVQLAADPYQPAIAEAAARPAESWPAPTAQSHGREWVYDAFTPPQIFFNARTKQFTVKPPAGFLEEEPEEAFGVELVAIKPEPFRLQLIGFVGDEGNWRGTFQNLVTGEVFLASSGRRVANLGLSVKSLEVRSQAIAMPESMTTRQRVATAVIHDDKTGRDVTLTHRERQFTGTLSAFVAASGETATREARLGDVFKIGPATYRVDRIQLSPPQVELTKEAPTLGQPDRRTLVPREAEGSEPGTSD